MKRTICLFLFVFVSFVCLSQTDVTQYRELDILTKKLIRTESLFKSNIIVRKISNLNVAYDSIVNHIKSNKHYSKDVEKGFIEWDYTLDSLNYFCYVFVPSDYNPDRRYEVSFVLHGAVMSLDPLIMKRFVKKTTYNVDSLDKIVVYPAGWFQSPWWHERQIKNLDYLLRRIKQNYSIDENNIHLTGISDGGTGIIYLASMNTTSWASFRPYISNPFALERLTPNPVYIKNLGNKPFLFISTEKDQLFPPSLIKSFLAEMDKADNYYEYHLVKGYRHETSWVPYYKDTIEKFSSGNPRNPYPSKVFWETDNVNCGRNHWVIIDKLATNREMLKEDYPVIKSLKNGLNKIPGVIKVEYEKNVINVETQNVRQYTLLLSNEQFNFNEEFQIYTNNKLSFKGLLEKDLKTLLKWYHADLDRRMLFGHEISIKVAY